MSTRATKKAVKKLVDESVKAIAPDVKPMSAKAMDPLLDAMLEVGEMATEQVAEVITARFVETLSDKQLTATIGNIAGELVDVAADKFAAALVAQLVEQFADQNLMDKVAEKIADQVVEKFGKRSAVIQLQ